MMTRRALRHAWPAALIGAVGTLHAIASAEDSKLLHITANMILAAALVVTVIAYERRSRHTRLLAAENQRLITQLGKAQAALHSGLGEAFAYRDGAAAGAGHGACYQSVVDAAGRDWVPVVRSGAHPQPADHIKAIERLESRNGHLADAPSDPGGLAR